VFRLVLFSGLAIAAATAASAQEPLTESSLRTMPPDVLARRLLGETATIVFPDTSELVESREESDGSAGVRYLTLPTASEMAGICQSQFLIVGLEPVGARGPDAPLRVRSIYTSNVFILQDVRAAGASTWPNIGPNPVRWDENLAARNTACAAIDPRQAELIIADDAAPGAIGRTVGLVADLVRSARAGRTPAPTTCDDISEQRLSREDCLAMLAAVRVERLNLVRLIDGCWGMDRPDAFEHENRCLQAKLWDPRRNGQIEIEFAFRWGRQELVSIRAWEQIGRMDYH